jgi:carboxypeptidase C (cathepsin A)
MYLNPKLKVLSLNGYHDLATPFYITEQDLGRLGTVAGLRIRHYPGGHMTYLNEPSRPAMKQDLVNFYARQM